MYQHLRQSVELFAGVGGLGMGVSLAGFKPAKIIEWDRNCCETLTANIRRQVKPTRGWAITCDDVRNVSFKDFEGKIGLLTGGPPCQPFSLGGRHKSHGDSRDMFPQAVRVVREARPHAFIFENVKGLTREAFRNYLEYVRLQLKHPELVARREESWDDHLSRLESHETRGKFRGLNYNVIVHLANAADYGVPQRRERVFFIGFRCDLGVSWHFPAPTHCVEALAWDQYRSTEYWDRHQVGWQSRVFSERLRARSWKLEEKPSQAPWVTVRDAISDLPDPEIKKGPTSGFKNHRFQAGARSYPGHTGSAIDEPAKTLKAGVHGVPGGENMLLKPNGAVRYFTVRESARLQTFPDAFEFNSSWTESMRQIGNAVPVKLAEVIATDIRRTLKSNNGSKTL
jgi:DNA (cytosine-5)-methyltransferase 1